MGMLVIDDNVIWGTSRLLLHGVLEFVIENTHDRKLKDYLQLCIIRNDSVFEFEKLTLPQKRDFYDGVSKMAEDQNPDSQTASSYEMAAFEKIVDLRDKLKVSLIRGCQRYKY